MAAGGQEIVCSTIEVWKEKFEEFKRSKKLVVLSFCDSGCHAREFMVPVLIGLAKKLPKVTFLKADPKLPAKPYAFTLRFCLISVFGRWEVNYILLKEGEIVDRIEGSNKTTGVLCRTGTCQATTWNFSLKGFSLPEEPKALQKYNIHPKANGNTYSHNYEV
ncbi:unnamed protein product [Dovyalis caffra]|uniref:Thioredoxin-like protein n=1 Tax=Dovyalis caffra TaxID=77055 RepID=A0AAV1S4A8_9ROSI|nr:unnamed protein product [Dovyalis caffra]